MDDLNRQALESLTVTLQALLPEGGPEPLRPSLTVHPIRIAPTGLGGFIAPHHEPEGDIVGRQLTATAVVTVRAGTLADLDEAASQVTARLSGAEARQILKDGFHQLRLQELGTKRPPEGQGANRTPAEQEVRFSVEYEFLKSPTEGEGIIEEIPIDARLPE